MERRGETVPRPWEVSKQAANDDGDDVITHELTGGDLTGATSHQKLDVCSTGKEN